MQPQSHGKVWTRRHVLAGIGTLAGGLAGSGIIGAGEAGASPLALAAAAPATRTSVPFSLAARNLRGLNQHRGPRRDEPGDQIVSQATLLDADGHEVGSFHSSAVVLSSPKARTAVATLEQHHFELGYGVIVGTGLMAGPGEPAEFAVIGGTGRFRASRGSYTVVQSPYHLGGDGTASFAFDLLNEE